MFQKHQTKFKNRPKLKTTKNVAGFPTSRASFPGLLTSWRGVPGKVPGKVPESIPKVSGKDLNDKR